MKGLNAVVGIKTAAQEEEEKEEDKKLRHVPGVRDIYVVGTTNVGKSTLINQMIKQRLLMTKRAQLVTTSPLPGKLFLRFFFFFSFLFFVVFGGGTRKKGPQQCGLTVFVFFLVKKQTNKIRNHFGIGCVSCKHVAEASRTRRS